MGKQVKIGDYIEGYEVHRELGYVNKVRLVVSNIFDYGDGLRYYGQADDSYKGARATAISEDNGEIRVITDEKPYKRRWWNEEKTVFKGVRREWKPGQVVRRYDGDLFKIVNIGINLYTKVEIVIYTPIRNSEHVFWETRDSFEELNTSDEGEQVWKFEVFQ